VKLYEDSWKFKTMSRRRPHEEDDGYGKQIVLSREMFLKVLGVYS
jgi:hypothetical protein